MQVDFVSWYNIRVYFEVSFSEFGFLFIYELKDINIVAIESVYYLSGFFFKEQLNQN